MQQIMSHEIHRSPKLPPTYIRVVEAGDHYYYLLADREEVEIWMMDVCPTQNDRGDIHWPANASDEIHLFWKMYYQDEYQEWYDLVRDDPILAITLVML
jgi:hypothetical protein